MAKTVTPELYKGFWRRFHPTHLRDRRFDGCSAFDEVVYFRLHLKADDFGRAEVDLLHNELFISRASTPDAVTADSLWQALKSLETAGLLSLYEAHGRGWFAQINDFSETQPAGLNGKRVMKCPPPQDDPGDSQRSQCVQTSARDCCGPLATTESDQPQTTDESQSENQIATAKQHAEGRGAKTRLSVPTVDQIYNCYPTQANKKRALIAIQGAIERLKNAGKADAEAWLQARVLEYARASEGAPKVYLIDPKKWFEDARYDDDPEAWQAKQPSRRKGVSSSGGNTEQPLLLKTRTASA